MPSLPGIEADGLQPLDIRTDRPPEQHRRHVVGGAEAARYGKADGRGILLQPVCEVGSVLDGQVVLDGKDHRLFVEHCDRTKIRVLQLRAPERIVGNEQRVHRHQIMRVAGVGFDVGQGDGMSAAGLRKDDALRRDEIVGLEPALQKSRHPVHRAAGRVADHELDRLVGFPLRRNASAGRQGKSDCGRAADGEVAMKTLPSCAHVVLPCGFHLSNPNAGRDRTISDRR